MSVHIVVGTWRGLVDHVQVWDSEEKADADADRLLEEYGIAPGADCQSPNSVEIFQLDVL
ncbi:MAG: hypothetical protein R6U89_05605 [Dehalococcoidia bacterium]